MEKFKKILFTFTSIIILLVINTSIVFARANSGSSGGYSGGSSSSYSDDNVNWNESKSTNVSGLLSISAIIVLLLFLFIYIYITFDLHYYVKKRIQQIKFLKRTDSSNKYCLTIAKKISIDRKYWSIYELNKRVENSFYRIENAWSNMDIDSVSSYLNSSIMTSFKRKIHLLEIEGKQNILENITLINSILIGMKREKNDTKDLAYFLINGSMRDYVCRIDRKPIKKLAPINKFIEVWKFARKDGAWVLDEIINEEKFPYREKEFNVIDNFNLL